MQKEAQLFQTVSKSINILTIDGVINTLTKAMDDKYSNESIRFILTTVTEVVGISIDQLSNPSIRDDKRKVSIGFCSYFLTTQYKYTCSFIAGKLPFNLGEDALRTYANLIKRAKLDKPKSDVDKLIAGYYPMINQIIINHKSNTQNEIKQIVSAVQQ